MINDLKCLSSHLLKKQTPHTSTPNQDAFLENLTHVSGGLVWGLCVQRPASHSLRDSVTDFLGTGSLDSKRSPTTSTFK